jgi:hypothetical protein
MSRHQFYRSKKYSSKFPLFDVKHISASDLSDEEEPWDNSWDNSVSPTGRLSRFSHFLLLGQEYMYGYKSSQEPYQEEDADEGGSS